MNRPDTPGATHNPLPGQVAAAALARTAWVDLAKGIGIILVVYGHVLRGNLDLRANPLWAVQDRWIYAFHMPLFFVVSGLFLWRSIQRGRGLFLRQRWWQMVYPYLLWSGVTAAIELAMAPWVNSPLSLRDALLIPLRPIEQYWFLYVLLILQVLIALLYPRRWLVLLAAVLAVTCLDRVTPGPFMLAVANLPFVACGVIAGPLLLDRIGRSPVADFALAALGAAVLAMAMGSLFPPVLTRLLAGLGGCAAVAGSASLLARLGGWARILTLLGQASMAIYVTHTIVSAGVRIGLKMVGVAAASPLSLIACTLAGLVAPTVLWLMVSRQSWSRWAGLGAAPAGWPAQKDRRAAPTSNRG